MSSISCFPKMVVFSSSSSQSASTPGLFLGALGVDVGIAAVEAAASGPGGAMATGLAAPATVGSGGGGAAP
jgi:hypothetical protein